MKVESNKFSRVVVNHVENNYFNDHEEVRVDRMLNANAEKVVKAIDKLVRRFKTNGRTDTMFVEYDDETGYRLMYKNVGMEQYEHPVFGTMYRGGHYELVIKHFTHYPTDSWDTEESVSVAKAKRLIIGKE